jgi:hypothetical protein
VNINCQSLLWYCCCSVTFICPFTYFDACYSVYLNVFNFYKNYVIKFILNIRIYIIYNIYYILHCIDILFYNLQILIYKTGFLWFPTWQILELHLVTMMLHCPLPLYTPGKPGLVKYVQLRLVEVPHDFWTVKASRNCNIFHALILWKYNH